PGLDKQIGYEGSCRVLDFGDGGFQFFTENGDRLFIIDITHPGGPDHARTAELSWQPKPFNPSDYAHDDYGTVAKYRLGYGVMEDIKDHNQFVDLHGFDRCYGNDEKGLFVCVKFSKEP